MMRHARSSLCACLFVVGCATPSPRLAPGAGSAEPDTKGAPLTSRDLDDLLTQSEQALGAAVVTLGRADDTLENWVHVTAYGEDMQQAFRAGGAELSWSPQNTRERVRAIVGETWGPCAESLGASCAIAEVDLTHVRLAREFLKHLRPQLTPDRLDALASKLLTPQPAPLGEALAALQAADRTPADLTPTIRTISSTTGHRP